MSRLKVRITGPHNHAGRDVPIGEVIELPAMIARLVVSVHKTGEPVDWPKRQATKKQPKAADDAEVDT